MISVKEAYSIIMNLPGKFSTENVPLALCTGRILAEDIFADMPFPSFDRVMMDGIAINYASWEKGNRTYPVQVMQPAGVPKTTLDNIDHCIEVMTGAVLPNNTNVVIPYEEFDMKDGVAHVNLESTNEWKNIHRLGTDRQTGDLLLSKNIQISPAEIATLAAVGKSEVLVNKLPKIAIISTGDELVETHEVPEPHQIRKSNSHALSASLSEMNIPATLIHLPDNREQIIEQLKTITTAYNVIILSGGVSKGKKDYVPEALEIIGVEKKFHRVKQRPGKPFWFGVNDTTTVFALPGNPVATFLCFYRYIKPWMISSLTGDAPDTSFAELTYDFDFKAPLTYFLQVYISNHNGRLLATPHSGKGSGDFTNLNQADGFLELPDDHSQFKKGAVYQYISFRK